MLILVSHEAAKDMIQATSNFTTALSTFLNGKILYRITIQGYSRVFCNYKSGVSGEYDWIVSMQDMPITIHDLDGGADQVQFSFNVQDRGAAITGDFPGFTFEGKQITLQTGFYGLAVGDFTTLFTGFIDTVASDNNNLEYTFNCSDISSRLTQVIYLTGDSGQPIDSGNPKTLLAHPLDLLLNILGTQIGLSAGQYDSTKIAAYRDGPFNGVQFQFHLTQSVAAIDFIKSQILKPLGGYLWVNNLGMLTVNFFYPLNAPVAVATFGPRTWTTIPTAEQIGSGVSELINQVQFQFDKDDASSSASGNYLAQDTEVYGVSVAKYAQYGEQTIQSDGLRSGFQGFFTARLVARMIFGRYGLKSLTFDRQAADSIWQTCLLQPGDIIAATHPQIPDRVAGVMGITGKQFEIINPTYKFTDGLMTFTMIDASYLQTFGLFKIAPNGQADYTSGSNVYMYLCNDSDKYTNGDAAHTLG